MSSRQSSFAPPRPLHVSVIALPESMLSPLSGVYEVLDVIRMFAAHDDAFPHEARFRPEIVAPARDLPSLTSELPLRAPTSSSCLP